ncbi:MAG: 4Fe-4S dicluster domain-containing protein [Candidatus Polarisedimenticolaceae bacterium]|nr:4Fe-4S dicluster domain-containing protein [Candidatus Polarisedimenticolaceae bacterium]
MKSYLLDSLENLFQHLAVSHKMFEPQSIPGSEDLHWLPSPKGPTSRYGTSKQVLPLAPAKGFLFPERELLFRFDGQTFIETLPEVAPQVLFGLQSCDLCAIAYQDQFFRQDSYYLARRKATILVGFDCLTPCDGGFCSTVDAGPFVRDGSADLILHPKGNEWLLIPASEQGLNAIQTLNLPPAPAEWRAEREQQQAEVAKMFPTDSHIRTGIERINQATISAEQWQRLGLQCLTCSGCTSLCPTCSCFTTFDTKTEGESNTFVRERCWDSCLYEAFQRETSGHNPSKEAGERLQRYWFHKFSDHYVDEFGRYGCIGCGRCEETCPGGIGVHSIMRRLEKES